MPAHGLPILLLTAAAASSQISIVPIEGQKAAEADAAFQRAGRAATMKCGFKPTAPVLNFSLQYDARYSLTFPLDPARGPSLRMDLFLRLRRENPGENPRYLASRYDLPQRVDSRGEATFTARFDLPAGGWRVEALAIDDAGKVCRADWRTAIKEAPAQVAEPRQALHHLSVFVDSESPGPEKLMGSLSALLRSLPAQAVRVVVFNLEQRKESFRFESFQPDALVKVAAAIEATSTGTVDYSSL